MAIGYFRADCRVDLHLAIGANVEFRCSMTDQEALSKFLVKSVSLLLFGLSTSILGNQIACPILHTRMYGAL